MKIEYEVINMRHLPNIINMVNEMIELGWEPVGGITSCENPEGFLNKNHFMQAMIRKKV